VVSAEAAGVRAAEMAAWTRSRLLLAVPVATPALAVSHNSTPPTSIGRFTLASIASADGPRRARIAVDHHELVVGESGHSGGDRRRLANPGRYLLQGGVAGVEPVLAVDPRETIDVDRSNRNLLLGANRDRARSSPARLNRPVSSSGRSAASSLLRAVITMAASDAKELTKWRSSQSGWWGRSRRRRRFR